MTSERPDLYAILGVAPNATQAQISHAYRALLRRHHPDTRDPADETSRSAISDATLQGVLAAYTVLGDPTRRADYDQHAKPERRPTRPARQTRINYAADGRPAIVAGPVRWHRGPDPA